MKLGRRWEWHYRRSLASRVILLTTMVVGLTTALVAAAAFFTVRDQMNRNLDSSLLNRAHKAASSPELLPITRNLQLPSWALGAADIRLVYIDVTTGRYVTADSGPTIHLTSLESAVAAGQRSYSIETLLVGGEDYRVVAVPTAPGQALVLLQSLEAQEKVLRDLAVVLFFVGLVGVVLAGVAGWGVARNGLRPVRRLTSSVEEIARTQDLQPLHVEGADEIARLGAAFNSMLASLAASRDRQRQLVADAGHELRTPLTSLRTNVDLLSQADSGDGLPPAARTELLEDVRAQAEELSTLVGDLVELAREDAAPEVIEEVDLADVVERAVTRVRRRAPTLAFHVDLEGWIVHGDARALERAATNLLDNAAKWSPSEGTVTVSLRQGVLSVSDQGPGIPEAERQLVFERFYRSDESRTMPGSGLGLAIVKQVADRHSGLVHAVEAPGGGTRMELWLPGQPA